MCPDQIQLGARGVPSASVPCVITLGGGYSEPIQLTVEAHANTFLIARDIYSV